MNEDTLWLQVPAAELDNDIRITTLKSTEQPCDNKIKMTLFAADHGMTAEETAAFSQSVTAGMIKEFIHMAPIAHTFIKKLKVKFEIINLGTVENLESVNGIINQRLGPSTANFCNEPAMSKGQFSKAINIGRQAAQRAKLGGAQLFICSEINTKNTISATTMTCALLNISPEKIMRADYNENKIQIIQKALTLHRKTLKSPLEILRRLGGFEIAALTGSYLCCAHMGLPVLINSFTSSVAALIAARLCPDAEQWFLFSDTVEEQGHKIIIDALDARPLWNSILNEKNNTVVSIFSKDTSPENVYDKSMKKHIII